MRKFTLEAKEAMVDKALSRGNQYLEQFAEENNVGCSTIYRWMKCRREGKPLGEPQKAQAIREALIYSSKKHVLATANLDKQAIGAYCREQGIYSFQLEQWREELMSNSDKNDQQDLKQEQDRGQLKKLRDENKSLKKDLRQKDKALAEANALLDLKKKADLIWGAPEDD